MHGMLYSNDPIDKYTVCFNIFDIFSGSLFIVIMKKKEKYYTKWLRKRGFLIINNKKYIL